MTDADLRNKRVLIREDLNVPVRDGVVTSDARIRASLATIRYALDQHARVFVLSHLGRPEEGRVGSGAVAGAGRGAAVGAARQAGTAAQGLARWCRLRRRQCGAVRERALQPRREAGRRAALAPHGGAVRSVRHGRLRHGASRRGEYPRRSALRAGRLRRAAAGGRARGPGARAGASGPAAGGGGRRRQGVDQAHGARVAPRAGRPADRRRRHRQHLPGGERRGGRQVAARGADAGRGAAADRAGARRAAPAFRCPSTWWWARNSPRPRTPTCAR